MKDERCERIDMKTSFLQTKQNNNWVVVQTKLAIGLDMEQKDRLFHLGSFVYLVRVCVRSESNFYYFVHSALDERFTFSIHRASSFLELGSMFLCNLFSFIVWRISLFLAASHCCFLRCLSLSAIWMQYGHTLYTRRNDGWWGDSGTIYIVYGKWMWTYTVHK